MIRIRHLVLFMFAVVLTLLTTSCGETVNPIKTPTVPTLQAITVSPITSSISHGQTQQFQATGQLTDGSTKPLTDATWSTSDASIVSVSASGLGTGVAVGSATISAKSGTVTGSTTLNVLPLASASFDATGGTLTVTVPQSPITGLKLVVPAGAIGAGDHVKISIDYANTLPGALPTGAAAASKAIVFEKDSPYNFILPVSVSMNADAAAFAAGDMPVMMYWSPTYSKFRATSVDSVDRTTNSLTFSTTHFGKFVLSHIADMAKTAGTNSIDTGFRPDVDGFFHPNFGSYEQPGGSSLGMALYSAWYFSSKKVADGHGLYTKYRDGDVDVWQDDNCVREMISRSYLSSSEIWSHLSTVSQSQLPGDAAISLWSALTQTNEPQPLLLKGTNWAHTVLVYAWDATAQQFLIYDNNFPCEVVTLGWTATDGFIQYSKAGAYPNAITNVSFLGFGLTLEGKEFEDFYNGAEKCWSATTFGTVKMTTPTPDANNVADITNDTSVQIDGTVTAGAKTPSSVVIYLDGEKIGVAPITSGAFTFTIPTLTRAASKVMFVATDDLKNPWDEFGGFGEYTIRIIGRTFITNAGFETGDFNGWTHETHTWYDPTPGSFTPEKSEIVAVGTDAIDTTLQQVYVGQHAVRVNNFDDSYHISTVSQTVTVPNIAHPQIRFYWAAVLEDPGHPPKDQPYVDIVVHDDTANVDLYNFHHYSNDPNYSGWEVVPNSYDWLVIRWQPVMIDVSTAKGHSVTIRVTAADCSQGGHGGYVYLDGDEN